MNANGKIQVNKPFKKSFSLLLLKSTEVADSNSSSRIKSRMPLNDDSEHSQSDTITYDDPAGRMEREKIMAQLKRGNSPSPDIHTEDEEEDRRDSKTDTVGWIWIKHARLKTTKKG